MRQLSESAGTMTRGTLRRAMPPLLFGAIVVLAVLRWLAPQFTMAQAATRPVVESLDDAHPLGSRDAQVGVVVFADFQCPYCKLLATDVLPRLRTKYVEPGLVRLGYRHLPLSIHSEARAVAIFSECLSGSLGFWDVHDRLFQNPTQFDEVRLRRLFKEAATDTEAFNACLATVGAEKVQRDTEDGKRMRLTGTPVLLIGRHETGRLEVTSKIDGLAAWSRVEAAIDEALLASRTRRDQSRQ